MSQEDNAPKRKKVGYKQIARPKHFEQLSTEESLAFTPWKITLKVETDKFEPEPVDYDIYLRCPDPAKAQWMAYGAFMSWEHHRYGIPDHDWPMVSEKVPSEAQKLTEKQYYAAWKEAQKHPMMFAGMHENPSIFRFMDDRWFDVLKMRQRRSIVVPDKAGWESVARAKAVIDNKLKKNL